MKTELEIDDLFKIAKVLEINPHWLGSRSLRDILNCYPIHTVVKPEQFRRAAIQVGQIYRANFKFYKILAVTEKRAFVQALGGLNNPIESELVGLPFYKAVFPDNSMVFGQNIAELYTGELIEDSPPDTITIGTIFYSHGHFYQVIGRDIGKVRLREVETTCEHGIREPAFNNFIGDEFNKMVVNGQLKAEGFKLWKPERNRFEERDKAA